MARRLPQIGGAFLQMEDEIAAMAAVIGGSLAGRKALTATSGPGFSLKQENMGFAMLTEIPCVIVNVMRGGPSTGVPTGPGQSDIMQCKWGTHGDHPVICLTPAYVQEIFSETVRAFNLSEKYRTPVIIAFDEIVGAHAGTDRDPRSPASCRSSTARSRPVRPPSTCRTTTARATSPRWRTSSRGTGIT